MLSPEGIFILLNECNLKHVCQHFGDSIIGLTVHLLQPPNAGHAGQNVTAAKIALNLSSTQLTKHNSPERGGDLSDIR